MLRYAQHDKAVLCRDRREALVTRPVVTPINLNGFSTLAGMYSAFPLPGAWPRLSSGGFANLLAAQMASMARFSLPPPAASFSDSSTPYTNFGYSPWSQLSLANLVAQTRTPHAAWIRPGLLPSAADQGHLALGTPFTLPWSEPSAARPPTPNGSPLQTTAIAGSPFPPAPVQDVGPAGKADSGPMALEAFPHPPGDNGRGMHWIPTVHSSPQVVDRFVRELQAMNIKWAVFLNDGANIGDNDYLVQQLVAHGIEPVMRVYTPGLVPISGDLGAMVRHYTDLGVHYFQLYNEPNVAAENGGSAPDVNRYLDLWLPAAKAVAANGGLPGFGALSPGGEVDDRAFLRDALVAIQARGESATLNRAWLASHNYAGERSLSDPDGFLRFRQYDAIIRSILGRSMPIVGTEGGSYTVGPVDQTRQIDQVLGAYRYMANREPYNFAYTYWVIANSAGGGHDPSWEWQALFRNGWTSPLVEALKQWA